MPIHMSVKPSSPEELEQSRKLGEWLNQHRIQGVKVPPIINQFAASIVAQATAPPVDLDNPAIRSQIMRAMGSRGGVKGAATLNSRLSPAQRKASARRAAQARWGKKAK
jgi:hypothetical protein